MHIVSEATQAEDTRIQTGAFGCLNRIMGPFMIKCPSIWKTVCLT